MVSGHFFDDHRKIDALLNRLLRDLKESQRPVEDNAPLLAKAFYNLEERLERHMRWEEGVLFPAIEAKAPDLAHGPGRIMRLEHGEIRSCLQKARAVFEAPESGDEATQAIRSALKTTAALLAEHNEKEETVYYPLCDHLLTAEEAAHILEQIQEPTSRSGV